MSGTTDMNWFCVHTKPGKESFVEHHLTNEIGLDCYFPRLKRKKIIRRVKRIVTEPLFPRYLFCQLDLASSYRAVRYAKDVVNIVNSGERPKVVADHTIAQLKIWAGEKNDIITLEPKPFETGESVEITSGPMQGLEAIFLHETNQSERVAILLKLMGAESKTVISRSQVEPVNN
ncbi:transcription termination/antitermination protein NusG [Candidatus Pelagisphaera phototrophica]|uniref:transcription termination/antitermination protein NusG n=1 Tax=Candidatus Pelagisphaera phototrophica TaxID=2684113 RepID=UPI001A065D7D|nr:transcription termination/antitermination NusG family protein [Candidatus Pelagisphaera phototrophica]QXD32445.1 hypothetical protein GA004_01590 [Candidatus Pelagisphaera phototrophica]